MKSMSARSPSPRRDGPGGKPRAEMPRVKSISRLGIDVRDGIGATIAVAATASAQITGPGGVLAVPAKETAGWLGPLPVEALHGIGPRQAAARTRTSPTWCSAPTAAPPGPPCPAACPAASPRPPSAAATCTWRSASADNSRFVSASPFGEQARSWSFTPSRSRRYLKRKIPPCAWAPPRLSRSCAASPVAAPNIRRTGRSRNWAARYVQRSSATTSPMPTCAARSTTASRSWRTGTPPTTTCSTARTAT